MTRTSPRTTKPWAGSRAVPVHINGHCPCRQVAHLAADVLRAGKSETKAPGNGAGADGLCGVQSIAGKDLGGRSIAITSNPKLSNVRCLGNIGGKLPGGVTIDDNKALSSIAPLKGKHPIQSVAGDVNVNLVHCLSVEDARYLRSLCQASAACHAKIEKASKCHPKASGSVLVGAGAGRVCGGSTGSDWTKWKLSGTSGLYMDVDTTKCKFDMTPAYVASLVGDAAHWQLVGVNSIYSPTKSGFRVYLWHPVLKGEYLRFFATRYKWSLSWLADTGRSAGITRAGKTGWKQFSRDTIYVDVDTRACGYGRTPSLVAALHGAADHWRTQGTHAIYKATATGFRVYVSHMSSEAITAAKAKENRWAISWVGSTDAAIAGKSDPKDWRAFCASRTDECAPIAQYYAVYTDVDTSAHKFRNSNVAYVTSVSGAGNHLQVTGGASLYRASSKGFRLYLDRAPSPKVVIESSWRVNYIAYEGAIDCAISVWSTWSACSRLCGVGTKTRTRVVTSPKNTFGSCPSLKQQAFCNPHACNTDCATSSWGQWSRCSASCGGGLQGRVRVVSRRPLSGGKAWPAFDAWSTCTKSCGTGSQWRSRATVEPTLGGVACPHSAETRACNTAACATDCVTEGFGAWSTCTKSCGTGSQKRSRAQTEPTLGGVACPHYEETRACNEHACPVDCVANGWSAWSTCTKSCEAGFQSRTRTNTAPQNGGSACPHTAETQACNHGPCPVHCATSTFSGWSTCDWPRILYPFREEHGFIKIKPYSVG